MHAYIYRFLYKYYYPIVLLSIFTFYSCHHYSNHQLLEINSSKDSIYIPSWYNTKEWNRDSFLFARDQYVDFITQQKTQWDSILWRPAKDSGTFITLRQLIKQNDTTHEIEIFNQLFHHDNDIVHLMMNIIHTSNTVENPTRTTLYKKNNEDIASSTDTAVPFIHNEFAQDTTKKYIFLTFDDGPQHGTSNVLEVLQKANVKGSFFMVGMHVFGTTERNLVNEIRNGYPHVILCNHSFSHANGHYKKFYAHPMSAFYDFIKTEKVLGVPDKIIRLPGRSAWVLDTKSLYSKELYPLCRLLDSAKFNVVGWDEEWMFSKDGKDLPVQSATQMAEEIEKDIETSHTHTKNQLVLLSHDRMFRLPSGVDSLYRMIMMLKERHTNWAFETIDHYRGIRIQDANNL